MLVDITPRASKPGTRKSGGVPATAPKKTSSTTGTTMVMSKLSPRRRLRINSMRSCASSARTASVPDYRPSARRGWAHAHYARHAITLPSVGTNPLRETWGVQRPDAPYLSSGFRKFRPYYKAQCHPERSEPASEVEGSATHRVERLGRGSFAGSG